MNQKLDLAWNTITIASLLFPVRQAPHQDPTASTRGHIQVVIPPLDVVH